jgi:hypothetical protein
LLRGVIAQSAGKERTLTSATVAIIPLDDRSVNYECLSILGEAAGFHVLLPPKEWLGTPWRVGKTDRLGAWLEEHASRADALVVAVDTLGYGGLVNSRRSGDTVATVMQRLDVLRRVKSANARLRVFAFTVLMRINRGNDAEEEKAYWSTYGAQLFRLSVLEDRTAMAVATEADLQELAALRPALPAHILDDYSVGRARNHAVNRQMIEWTAEGIFDYLIVPQDDTVAYGWNIAEARRLRQLVIRLGLAQRVSIYPGTDETAMLLLARYAAQRADFRPRVSIRYSGSGADQVITAYEDRPMTEMVKAHLGPLGGIVVPAPSDANLLLYVNAPAEEQGNGPEQYVLGLGEAKLAELTEETRKEVVAYQRQPHVAGTLREMHTVRRDLPEFVRSLEDAVKQGYDCAVVDVAYVNAGDVALGALLLDLEALSQLAAYGGWNTAGNTLGCVLAQAVIRCTQRRQAQPKELAAHVRFLFLRLLEDSEYMGRLRTQIMIEDQPRLGLLPTMSNVGDKYTAVLAIVEERLQRAAVELARKRFTRQSIAGGESRIMINSVTVCDVSLPWQRLFDLTFDVALDYAEQ